MPENTILSFTVQSSREDKKQAINRILLSLAENNIQVNIDEYELYLVLDEILTNAMEHGNLWNRERKVFISVTETDTGRITVSVKDQGLGFNTKRIPDRLRVNGEISPRGRGLYIVRRFCDIEWNRLGNEVFLKIKRIEADHENRKER